MLYDVVLILIGLGLVAKGGDLFVDSSVSIGHALRVPRFVIGGTLVSLATTTPELVVSAMASSVGDTGIALGNAIGSCICNIGLIIGTVAMLTPVEVEKRDFVSRSAWMVSAAVLVVVFTWHRTLSRPLAILLLAFSFAYLAWDYVGIRRRRRQAVDSESPDTSGLTRAVTLFALGAVLIVFGSRLLVDSGRALAAALGVPSIIIGLSVVAIGTSLPEFVTTIVAVRRGALQLAVGGIIGGNTFDTLFLVASDLSFREGSLYHAVGTTDLYWLGTGLLMTGILLAGLIARQREGPARIGFESVAMLGVYAIAATIEVIG